MKTSLRPMLEVRTPPQDMEAEQAVLGALFLSEMARGEVSYILKEEDFYREQNRKVFRAIMELYHRNEPSDVVTVKAKLEEHGTYDEVGGVGYLTKLVDFVPTASNVEYYAQIVKEAAKKRAFIRASENSIQRAYNGDQSADQIAEDLVSQIVIMDNFSDTVEPMSMASETFERLMDEKRQIYIPTGWKLFDEFVGGFKRGILTTITGQSEDGKSTAIQNAVLNMAKEKVRITYVYLDDNPRELSAHHICMMRGWDIKRIESRDPELMNPKDFAWACDEWAKLGIRVAGRKQIGTKFKRFKFWLLREYKKFKPEVVVIDSGDRIHNDPIYGESRWDAQERMVDELEQLAQSLDIALLVIVGQAKTKKDKFHKVDEDEGGTNAWRKYARMRLLISKHEKAEEDPSLDDIRILKITKNTNGPKKSFWFKGDRKTFRWKEYDITKGGEE